MSTKVHVVVALGDVAADAWPGRLAGLRALGIDGVDLELVWRRHAAAGGRADFTGPLDVGRVLAAIADAGLTARLDVGPLRGHASPGLGAPDHVLADERTWARAPHGGPVWLPVVPRAVPLLCADSDALRAAVEIWLSQVAEALAASAPTAPIVVGAAPATTREARLRAAAFAFDYHPDAVRAWRPDRAAAPTAWPAPDAAAWLVFTDGADARLRHFVDERLAIELGHRGVASTATTFAPALEPAPLLLPQAPSHDAQRALELAARAALQGGHHVVRVRLLADAAPTSLAWLPRQRAELAAAAAAPTIAVVDTRADARIAAASSVVPGVPTALLAWAAGAAPADVLVATDAAARRSRTWAAAIDAGITAAGVQAVRLDADASDDDLARHPVVVVPTVARVELDLWRRLCALAVARRTVVVVGDTLPTHDELDQPLPPDLSTGRRIGRMQTAAATDAALLGRDLLALLGSVGPRPGTP